MALSSNIEAQILTALKTIFAAELQAAFPLSDPLRIKLLKSAPLQADPTTVAPYLIYGPAFEIGRTRSKKDVVEIGGGILWDVPFRATCGTPKASNQDTAYSQIEELAQRVENTLLAHFDLFGVLAPNQQLQSQDGSAFIDAMDPSTFWIGTRIYGGDTEWYGESLMYFCYSYYRLRNW
jgi:hypothetical protein